MSFINRITDVHSSKSNAAPHPLSWGGVYLFSAACTYSFHYVHFSLFPPPNPPHMTKILLQTIKTSFKKRGLEMSQALANRHSPQPTLKLNHSDDTQNPFFSITFRRRIKHILAYRAGLKLPQLLLEHHNCFLPISHSFTPLAGYLGWMSTRDPETALPIRPTQMLAFSIYGSSAFLPSILSLHYFCRQGSKARMPSNSFWRQEIQPKHQEYKPMVRATVESCPTQSNPTLLSCCSSLHACQEEGGSATVLFIQQVFPKAAARSCSSREAHDDPAGGAL